ncbi:ABC transporter permease [Thermospira aquatica]|uniref:ABC transporter permease n=1 Tax=Thermospira aquatica TaxID=2828656 RepID=A0AAX3BFE1_9SPIR|nr:ABC transporter permease [Thermospira aquatica]URA11000.1 ABC transporter permease [Thermospira aquatica]
MREKQTVVSSLWSWFFVQMKLFFREPAAVFWIVVFPLLLLVIMGSIFSRYEQPMIRVAVYDGDGTDVSRGLVEGLGRLGVFVVEEMASREEVERKVQQNTVVLGILLSSGFGEEIRRDGNPFFEVLYNASQKEMNTIAFSILDSILYEEIIQRKKVEGKITYLTKEIKGRMETSYVDFLLPGLLALVVLSSVFFSFGQKMIVYREYGVLKQLSLFPVPGMVYVGGDGLAQFLVTLVQGGVLCGVGFFLYRVHLPSSLVLWLGMIVYLGFGFFALATVALFVAGFAKTSQGSIAILNLFAYVMMFLGGLYFPLGQMPVVLQWVAYALPATHFLEGLRFFFVEDGDLMVVVRGGGILLAYTLVAFPLVVRRFRWISGE